MSESVRSVLGPKWSLEILTLLGEAETLNYTEIEDEIPTSSDVVSQRLQLLGRYGLLTRTEHGPQDVRYSITEDGRGVLKHVRRIESRLPE